MAKNLIHTPQYRAMRATLKHAWRATNAPCYICGQATINWDGEAHHPESFELEHVKPRRDYPHLTLDPNNSQPSHTRCNRSKGTNKPRPSIGTTSEPW